MKSIFIGYLLIFLDFNFNLNGHVIGILPDFIGFILIAKGLQELSRESERFPKVRPWAIGMAVYTAVLYVLDLVGFNVDIQWLMLILSLIATSITLYISYSVILGVKDIEANRNADLNSEKLRTTYIPMAVLQVVSHLGIFIPYLAIVCSIISVILVIVFLVQLNRTKKAYEALPQSYEAANTDAEFLQ